jgi:hypothetical protein
MRGQWEEERRLWQGRLQVREQTLDSERQQMEEERREFASMLQSTLDKMGQRLEISNEWQPELSSSSNGSGGSSAALPHQQQQPPVIIRTLEEFQLAKSR